MTRLETMKKIHELLGEAEGLLNDMIMLTPTGEIRDKITVVNINVMIAKGNAGNLVTELGRGTKNGR